MARSARVKPASQVPDSVLASALIDAVHAIQKPVTVAVLAKNLVGPFKRSAVALEPILAGLVAEGRLILLPAASAKKKPAYSTRSIEELARLTVIEVLSGPAAPFSFAKLKSQAIKALAEYAPGINLPRVLEELINDRRVFVHPKCTAAGKIQVKPGDLSYGTTPPRPEAYLAPTLKNLKKQIKTLAVALGPFGVEQGALQRALLGMLQRELGTATTPPLDTTPGSVLPVHGDLSTLAQLIYDRMAELNPAVRTGAMVRLDRLRTLCWDLAETKAEFDNAVRWLAATHRVALHRHDDPHGLTVEERAALVPDDHDGLYNAASWRI